MRTVAVRAMRVELATRVAGGDVHLRKVADACDLDVVRRLHEVRAADSVRRDRARAVAVLEAPRYFNALGVTDGGVRARLRRGVEAEVIDRIDCKQ